MAAPSVWIVPATMEHAAKFGARMRDSDVVEVYAASGYLPVEAVEIAIRCSVNAWTCFFGTEIAACFGIASLSMLDGVGVPWALTGEVVDKHPILFYRTSKEVLAWMRQQYPTMVNRIDSRNLKAIRWARRVGFEVKGPDSVINKHGIPYHHCAIRMRSQSYV